MHCALKEALKMPASKTLELGQELILIIADGNLLALKRNGDALPTFCPIHAEEGWQQIKNAKTMKSALQDIHSRFGAQAGNIYLIYTDDSLELLREFSSWDSAKSWHWQWLRWTAFMGNSSIPNLESLRQNIIPKLLQRFTGGTDRHELIKPGNSQEALGTTRDDQEILLLEQKIRLLKDKLGSVNQVDCERLLTYLPALYRRAFTVIGPVDLAMLCGRVEPFNIPSPYPEPSDETLHQLQRQFLALPLEKQLEIVGFTSRLPKQLELRREMQETVDRLALS
jgi:hypothetical protein